MAGLTMTENPRGTITYTISGRGNCFLNGNNGGPVRLSISMNGGPFGEITNCQDGPCSLTSQIGASCSGPQTWTAEAHDCLSGSCGIDSPGYATASLTIDHSNSLSDGPAIVAGGALSGVLYAHAPAAWSARAIHYTWLLNDGTTSSPGSIGIGSGTPDDFTQNYLFAVPPGGGTLIATLDSCSDRFSSVALDAGGDHVCVLKQPACPCVGRPIRLSDGNTRAPDADPLPTIGGVPFARVYDSAGSSQTWFSAGWSSLFDRAAYVYTNVVDGPWVMIWLDGTKRYLFHNVQGTYVQAWPMGTVRATLTVDSQTGAYVLHEPDRDIEVVMEPVGGLPIEYRSRSTGRKLSITYNGTTPTHVSDSWGAFGWTVATTGHRIDSVTVDGTSLIWQYVYDNNGALAAVNGPGGTAWRTYTYTGNLLFEMRDAAGKLIESHTYDASGRGYTSVQSEDDIQSIAYDVSTRNTYETMESVTAATGAVTNYWLGYFGGRPQTIQIDGNCSACGTNDAVFAFNPADFTHKSGQLLRMQDARGYITAWTYDSIDRVTSVTRGYKPASCDPETDPGRCRQLPDALRTLALQATSATSTVSYAYGDANWLERPTVITRSSVANPGATTTETRTYDAASGVVLSDVIEGYLAAQLETHTTATAIYDGAEGAAFDPGGAFDSAWLSLPQPKGLPKSIDGPRTDAADLMQRVYYPIDNAVPALLRGHLAAIRDAAGNTTRLENYDVFGNATRVVDANGVATESTYDAAGRPLTSTLKAVPGCKTADDPLCATDIVSTSAYASTFGPLASQTRPNSGVISYEYDARGRVSAIVRTVSASLSERIEYDYDTTTGRKSAERYLSGQPGSWALARSDAFRYDIFGRLIAVDHPDGKSVLYTYDGMNNVATVQDENHTTANTTYKYDPVNRLTRVTQTLASAPGGSIATQYGYDLDGNLTSVTDPNGNVTSYAFDDFGRMTQQVSPVSGTTTYAYDPAGNLTSTSDANGSTTTRTYDALNRVTSSLSTRGGATETVSSTYDDPTAGNFGLGRAATLTDPTGSTSYRYTRRGQLRSEAKTIGGSTYTTTHAYDADGNRSTINYPGGPSAQYTFDLADRPYSLAAGATNIISSAAYLPFGPLATLAFGNGTTRTMRYDSRYRPLENKLTGPAGTIADYTYAEDNVGNITQIHDALDAQYNRDFGYDDLSRLTTANSGRLLWGNGAYAYDPMGNMLTASLGAWQSSNFTLAGTTPKLSNVVDNGASRAVTYDPAGNETAVGTSAYAYSPRNELASVDEASYAYDGRGLMTIATLPPLSLTAAPSAVAGGAASTGTVSFRAPVTADTTVALSSTNPSVASVPASVVVPAGSASASFTITTAGVGSTTAVTLLATSSPHSVTLPLYVIPSTLGSVSVSPGSVFAGTPATGTVSLAGTTTVDRVVALSSSNTAVTVPSSVTIVAGASSANFAISTSATGETRTVTITAALDGNTRSGTLTLTDVQVASLSITPTSLLNGGTASGTVTLSSAPPVAINIGLGASSFDASPTPAPLTIPAGATSANFTLNTSLRHVTPTSVIIQAARGVSTKIVTITVNPPWLTSLSLSPFAVTGGDPSIATGTLNGPAPLFAGYQVTFTSSNTGLVATPRPINYPNAATTGQTRVLTNPVTASTPVLITGTDSTGVNQSQTLTLQPATVTLSALTLSVSSIVGSNQLTGTVTLTGAAPAGGANVDLKTSRPDLVYPGMLVRVPAGSQSATFTIITHATTLNASATISAVHYATTKTATLNVQAPSASFWLNYVTLASQQVTGGSPVTGTVNLSAATTAGRGTTINLSSSNTAVATVPASVTVPKGSSSQNFTVTTSSVTSPADVAITASGGGTTQTVKLIVLPSAGVAVASIAPSQLFTNQGYYWSMPGPADVTPVSALATITLTGPAPAGGANVTVSVARANVLDITDAAGNASTVVTVPAGSTSATLLGRVYPFTGIDRGTTIAATYGNVTRSIDVLVTAIPQASISRREGVLCASTALPPCLTAAALRPRTLAAGDSTQYYLYTPELHLMSETEVSTAAAKSVAYSYLWFGDIPVASVETATSTTRWYMTDHLGTPIMLTDTSGVPVWRAEYTPYGAAYGRTGSALHQPLRLPGQQALDGSDLSYNVFRWYPAGWGRYTQPDPLPSWDIFGYAFENPISYIDPLGLRATYPPPSQLPPPQTQPPPQCVPLIDSPPAGIPVGAALGYLTVALAVLSGSPAGGTGDTIGDPLRTCNSCDEKKKQHEENCDKILAADLRRCEQWWLLRKVPNKRNYFACRGSAMTRYSECLVKGSPISQLSPHPWQY